MCCLWVGFLFSFAGGRKKQNKFPSGLHRTIFKEPINIFLSVYSKGQNIKA
jgi:hypothetical protein